MENERKNKRSRTLPKRLLDSVVESPVGLNQSDTIVKEIVYLNVKEDENVNQVIVNIVDNSNDVNEPSINDHFYCKKDQKLNESQVCIQEAPHPENFIPKTSPQRNETLISPVVSTEKRKRGRPTKRKISSNSSNDVDNENCVICMQRLKASLSWQLDSQTEDNISALQMIEFLASESNKSINSPTSNQYICTVCFDHLRHAYSSLLAYKGKLKSFVSCLDHRSEFASLLEDRNSSNTNSKTCEKNEKNTLNIVHAKADDEFSTNFVLSKDLNAIFRQKMVSNNYDDVLRSIWRKPGGKKSLISFLRTIIAKELNTFSSSKDSVLLQNFCEESVHKFGWKQLQDEMETHLPVLTAAVKSAVFNKCQVNSLKRQDQVEFSIKTKAEEDYLRKTVCLGNVMANLVYLNNKKMKLVQEANSVMLFNAGCTNWMLKVLHHLGICVPAQLLKPYIDLRRQTQDIRMHHWRKRIMKPDNFMKVFSYTSGATSAKDIEVDDDIVRSTETTPKDCKVVYIQGIKTSVGLHRRKLKKMDSDDENEDELKLPMLLEEKYNKEVHQYEASQSEQNSDTVLMGCQNALNKALQSIGNHEKKEHGSKDFSSLYNQSGVPFKFQKPVEEDLPETVYPPSIAMSQETESARNHDLYILDSSISTNEQQQADENVIAKNAVVINADESSHSVIAQSLENIPEMIQNGGEVMYLVMDNNESAENILLDLQQAGFTTM